MRSWILPVDQRSQRVKPTFGKVSEYAQDITESGTLLLDHRNILDLTKLEAGKTKSEPQMIDLKRAINMFG